MYQEYEAQQREAEKDEIAKRAWAQQQDREHLEALNQEEQEAEVVQHDIRHMERQDVQKHEATQRKARRNSLVARAMEKERIKELEEQEKEEEHEEQLDALAHRAEHSHHDELMDKERCVFVARRVSD
jgi:hypothetical protein